MVVTEAPAWRIRIRERDFMTKRSIIAKGALAAAAGALALGAAAGAAAQPYGYNNGGYYDPCQRDATGRGVVGAVLGGAGGAVIGSQFAASGHRRDGSLLGGVLGAVAGGMVGNHSAACQSGGRQPYPAAPPPPSAYNGYYDNGYTGGRGYYGRGYSGSAYNDDYAYGDRGERLRVVERPAGRDGCTLAESPIYLPDGRVQKRFVRVCMDSTGRYQVVD
jgi:hypothetical protein